jgi:hypothetical protein
MPRRPGLRSDERKPKWKPRPWRRRVVIVAMLIAIAVVLALTVPAFVAISRRGGGGPLGLDNRCDKAAFSCGVVGSLLISIVPIAAAVLTLLLWRLSHIRRQYRKRARKVPEVLVQTTAANAVVGRQGLCDVLQANVQDRRLRRPQLLVGGVGVGKTAVLVRLTRLLAIRRAVPVPIRLRDAQKELDFASLARKRFLAEMEPSLLSETEGDQIWRKLLAEDRVVVLADGLEEALIGPDAERSRDTTIQLAFDAATDAHLPLIVTSRPHDTMRYVSAATLRLEPLSEAAAVDFILSARPDNDDTVRTIVEQAEVVEAPLYMQLARALHRSGRLTELDVGRKGRLALRVTLLDTWRRALIDRELFASAPHVADEREQALTDLEALACVGLAADRLEVGFGDLNGRAPTTHTDECADYRELLAANCSDVHLAANVGARLDIVEAKSMGVRFRHSIVQAYLGSRRMSALLGAQSDYLDRALSDPSREALMALVMFCWREEGRPHRRSMRDRLLEGPGKRNHTKAIDMLAAAVEIDSMIDESQARWLDRCWDRVWVSSRDQDTEQAKLRAVARLGESGRAIDCGDRPSAGAVSSSAQAAGRCERRHGSFVTLWNICLREETYSVRLAAAQELGAAGSAGFEALRPILREALQDARGHLGRPADPLAPQLERRFALQGWILPLLVRSVDATHTDQVKTLVAEWIDIIRSTRGSCPIEASWAQGFKYEANIHRRDADPAARLFLAKQASLLADGAVFWYARICLLHAFALWSLGESGPDGAADGDDVESAPEVQARRAYARRRIESWGIDLRHPLVAEAGQLCELARQSDRPTKYIWIDEAGVVAKLGPKAGALSHVASSRLWISPAAGWLALDERARRLVAEIVVLLNLAEGTDRTMSQERLSALGDRLPPCMIKRGGRANLEVGGVDDSTPRREGVSCDLAKCLCPYAAPGQQPFRGELTQAFCAEQLRILGRARGRRAPWQRAQSHGELRRFWQDIERRSVP